MRKLEKDPMCMSPFPSTIHNSSVKVSNFLIVNMDATVQVFIDFCMAWSAKTDCGDVPVHCEICNTFSQRGLIATLDETGVIKLSYLGTSPLASAVSSFSRDLNYDKIDEEHKRLLQIIRDSQMTSNVEAKEKLVMRAQVNFFWFTYVISMFYIIFF